MSIQKNYDVVGTINSYYPRFSPSGLNKIVNICPSVISCPNTDPSDPAEPRTISHATSLNLPIDASDAITQRVIKEIYSFKDYMEYALYDKQFGYYTTRPGIGTHFFTTPMDSSPHYGAALAKLVMRQWYGMVEAGSFAIDERFDVLELGAGTGILARDFVEFTRKKASCEKIWKIFYQNLCYRTGEISPDLQEKQRQTTQVLKDKIQVVPADARDLQKSFAKHSLQGLILSNELPDAFSCHKVIKSENGHLFAAVTVPVVYEFTHFIKTYHELLPYEQAVLFKELIPEILKKNEFLSPHLNPEYGFLPSKTTADLSKEDYGYLSRNLYEKLRILELDFFEERIKWLEFWVPIALFPEIDCMKKDHRDFFHRLPPQKPMAFNTDLRPFQEGCGAILAKGHQMHIDYMYDYIKLIKWTESFRTFPSADAHTYRNPPGEEDITSDVNATALAVEGIRAGFKTFFYCSERELHSQLPETYPHLKIRREGLPFHILSMTKKGTNTAHRPHVLTRPVTYRELFLKQSDWSCTAIPGMRCIPEKSTLIAREIYSYALACSQNETNPSLIEIDQAGREMIAKAQTKNPLMQQTIKFLLPRIILFKPNLMEKAKTHTSVADFDYSKINSYFKYDSSTDQLDRFAIQLVHHILHLYYSHPKKFTIE
jgi:SAM-dependent MidA family methyltransferase